MQESRLLRKIECMKVNGVGGVFIKARDPEKLYSWYEKKLGLMRDESGSFVVPTEKLLPNYLVISFFPYDTSYFSPSSSPCMLNFQVGELEPFVSSLSDQGVKVDKATKQTEFGRFAWVYDPEGNKIELWEPPAYRDTLINLPEAE